MRKKTIITVLLCILVCSMFIACGPKAAEPAKDSATIAAEPAKPEAAAPAEGKKQPVTLRFLKLTDELEAQALAEIVAEFQKIEDGKYAHVSVVIDAKPYSELFAAIENAVATGSDIDIVQADGPDVKHFAYNKVLMDVTDHFTPEEMAQWAPQSIAEGTFEGRFYGPPECQSCQLMWFNKDMLDAAGIDYTDTAGWTFGENGTALPRLQKLTIDANGDGTPEVFGATTQSPYDYYTRSIARSNGTTDSDTYKGISSDGMTFSGYFNTDESKEAYQFIQDMIYKYKVMSNEEIFNQMLAGLSATFISQDMIVGTQKDQYPDFHLGGIDPMYFVTPICQTGSWHWGITRTTKNFDEALAFVKFMSSDKGASYIWKYKNQFPANVNLYNSISEFTEPGNPRNLMVKFFEKHGIPRVETPAYTEYSTLFNEFMKSIIAGEKDVSGLTDEYAGLMDQVASKYKK